MRTMSHSAGVVPLRLTQVVLLLGILMEVAKRWPTRSPRTPRGPSIGGMISGINRVVAYGDSIYSGYNGAMHERAKICCDHRVRGRIPLATWNADMSVRRAKAGAVASDIYNNKIVAESSYMQDSSTRVVTFEMCGNEGCRARSSFKSQTGTCNYASWTRRSTSCKTYQSRGGDGLYQRQCVCRHQDEVISNLYYPGYAPTTSRLVQGRDHRRDGEPARDHVPPHRDDELLDVHVRAGERIRCAKLDAQYMGADYDTNGDGKIDSDALTYVAGETESGLRYPHLPDASLKDRSGCQYPLLSSRAPATTTSNPTIFIRLVPARTLNAGLFGGRPPDRARRTTGHPDRGGKNPICNKFGHERAGWLHSLFSPAAP